MGRRQPKLPELESPHAIRDFLTAHEEAFTSRYKTKPAKYTAKDAKHAKDLIDYYGYEGAVSMLYRFFRSRDKFISESGHGMGILATSTVQNKLIAEAVLPRRGNFQATDELVCCRCKREPVDRLGNYCEDCRRIALAAS